MKLRNSLLVLMILALFVPSVSQACGLGGQVKKCEFDKGYFLPKNVELACWECLHYGFQEDLIIVHEKGKGFGYANRQGEVVIDTIFQKANPFIDELAVVQKNNQYGFIKPDGEFLIEAIYDEARPFSDVLAEVKKDDKTGYINKKGELIIPLRYESGGSFSDGIAIVRLNGKYGVINKSENIQIPFIYDNAFHQFTDGITPFQKGDKWGFVDKNGNIVIPFIYDDVQPIQSGQAWAKRDDKFGYIDKNGNEVIPIKYDRLSVFSNDNYSDKEIAEAKRFGLGYVIDRNGDIVRLNIFLIIKLFFLSITTIPLILLVTLLGISKLRKR